MKFFTGITKLASVPPWASKHEVDGQEIYWTEVGKHPVALRARDNRVHLPKGLRGKAVADIRAEDLDALPKEDSGKAHYDMWSEDFTQKRNHDKIYNGYSFTPFGLVLVERLKKYLSKCKCDQVEALGLDPKYNIKPETFDKLLASNDINKVRTMLRSVAKKYRMIAELLKAGGKARLVTRMDKDFYYHWSKLESFADFDPTSYKPQSEDSDGEKTAKKAIDEELIYANEHFKNAVEPLLDPQMPAFIKAMESCSKYIDQNNIRKAQAQYEVMMTELMRYVGIYGHHPVGQKAEQILQLPSLIVMHSRLFGAE